MDVLLLHGAIGSSSQMLPLANLLAGKFNVSAFDFYGHGSRSGETKDLSIAGFAEDVMRWMEAKKNESIDIFGYSMGGYVALYLARHYPEKVNRIFTLATKFRWSPQIAANEIKMLDPEKIAEKVPVFAKTLAERHGQGSWQTVLQKTAQMMQKMGESNVLGPDDFKSIGHRVLLSIGDRDKLVTLDETLEVYKTLPNSSLLVLPGTGHPVENVNLEILAYHIHNFFK